MILLDFSTFNPPLSPTNPYLSSVTQAGFVTHGPAMIVNLLGQVSDLALKACWHGKWSVHRPLRPGNQPGPPRRTGAARSATSWPLMRAAVQ